MPRLFGTDGVRGLANVEVTAKLAMQLGSAAASYFAGSVDSKPKIYIGRDTRLSGDMLEAALAAGICSAGGEAHLLGVLPTPAIAYLTANSAACAGVVISASHNSFEDNGIKFFSAEGFKLADEVEDKIQHLLENPDLLKKPTGRGLGFIVNSPGLAGDYIDFVVASAKVSLAGLKIVLDCANGAAYEVAPVILRRLGAQVIVLNNEPDGLNINHNAGSTHLEGLCRAVLAEKADLGIAHDGDADRCLVVDEKGQIIDGDQMLFICALELMRKNRLAEKTLVTTVMSNIGLHLAIKEQGGKCIVTQVGDRYVLEAMRSGGYNLGGEQSGHIIFGDIVTTGDGLVTATQVLRAVVKNNKPISQLAGLMTKYPQVLKNIRVKNKTGWEQNAKIKQAIEYAEKLLGEKGRVLVRASGTEPLLRVMVEGPEQKVLDELTDYIGSVIEKELV